MQTDVTDTHHNQTTHRAPSAFRWRSRLKFSVMLLGVVFVLTGTSVRASDPIGVFAKIDKVVLEPSEGSPERIQLWGAFCLADSQDRDKYLPPQKGYLYYKLPTEKSEAARKEWNDLKATAGSGSVIGFGSRDAAKPKVRGADEKAADPDVYPVAFGLVKSDRRGSNYPPIKALEGAAGKTSARTEQTPQRLAKE